LVYDFGDFDQRFYEMTYPTPDATELAKLVTSAMPDHAPVHQHPSRGLDHGAWVPLKVMYPLGDVPVLHLSMPTEDPLRLMEIGQRLKHLREQGVLIIGSGFMTHGLPHLTRDMFTRDAVASWSSEFDAWVADALERRDVDALANFAQAPGMPYAHPTSEHYTPLFVALGVGNDTSPVQTTIDGYAMGLAKRSFQTA
jgi:4,5-DOPA dioxygenase extradiol